MKKNLSLIIIIFILITSCGKKNDPKYDYPTVEESIINIDLEAIQILN